MNAPAWFKWIDPLPTEEWALVALEKDFERLVEEVKIFPARLDFASRAGALKSQAALIQAAVGALDQVPRLLRGEHFYDCRNELVKRVVGLARTVKGIGYRPKRGHPEDKPKRECWIEAYLFIAERGLVVTTTRTGTVPGLAQALWQVATGEGGHSVDAWFQLGKRAFPELQSPDANEIPE